MNRITSTLAVSTSFIACLWSSTAFAGDALTIRDIAPDNALLVVGADDIRAMIDSLGPTALGKLWNDPALAEEVKKLKADFEEGLNEAATAAGVDRSAMSWPSSVGLAVMAEIDEELGLPTTQFVFFCDWSAEAENAAKMLDAMMAEIEKSAKESGTETKTEEIRGRRVLVSKIGGEAADGADEGLDEGLDEGDGMDGMGGMGFGGPDFAPKELCVVSDKGRLFASGSVAAMDMLLARVDGDHSKSVGESTTFKGAMDLAGGTDGVYAVISTEAAQPLLGIAPQFMLVEPLIKRFFGDIKAWSFGLQVKDGILNQCAGIYVPDGKVGLLSLIDTSSEPKAPPSVVPSDAMSYGRVNVRFDKIVAMIDDAIGGLPEEQAEMIKPQIDMFRPAMSAAFAAMGPEVHVWSTEPDAGDPMSSGTVAAITMKNDKDSASAVSDFINLLPLGLQSRDFNGMTILSDEFSPIAVGIGGGYMMLGQVKHVEQGLRSVDAKGEAGLAGDAQFVAALASMPKQPLVGMAWWNFGRQIEQSAQMIQGMTDQLGGMAGIDDEADIPGIGVGLDDVSGFWTLMKPEVVKRCFGDAMLDFTSTKGGFMTRWRLMPAATK